MDVNGLDVQAVQNFLRLARGAQNKDDFMSRVREFDQKFIDGYPAPSINPLPNIPRSNSQSANNFKTPAQQTPKNPFLNTAEEKYRTQRQAQTANQFKYPSTMNPGSQVPQMPVQGVRPRMAASNNIPHSRSETNFYRLEEENFDDFNMNNISANEFYNADEGMYRPNMMMNKSYSQQPDPRPRNIYANTQPYIQNNEFIANYEVQQPQYVKYYKKMIPQQNPKANFAPTPRSNPFKQ